MSSFMSSFITLIAVLVGVTVVVALLAVVQLRTYSERQARKRNEEVAEQVKKQLADLRNSRPPQQQQRVDQDNNAFEDTGHEAAQRAKELTRQSAGQAQGTVGQDADQTRATEAEPWTTFHLGSTFDRQGEYDRAVEAYRQVIDSEHPEAAPRAAFNLGILFGERGEYDRAVEAYQQAIDAGHAEWAPKAAFDLGMLFEERGEYDLAEKAYQQAINSRHPEVAPMGTRNLRGLAMRLTARESGGG
jgi:tetratricopeptide (TPR) repeat protein